MKKLADRATSITASITLAFAAKAGELKSKGYDVISLTVGEPDFATPKNVKDAAFDAINNDFTHYTPAAGTNELKAAVVEKYKREFEAEYTNDCVVVSNGAKHSLTNAIFAICQKGDEVVVPTPSWVSYPEIIKLTGAEPVLVDCPQESGFKITPEQLRAAVTEKTKMLIICSPSNPCGTVYSKEDLMALVPVIKETGIYVIFDEIYEKLVYDGFKHTSMTSFDDVKDQIISINGVSKAYAMTGWRIGYSVSNPVIAKACKNIQSHMTSAPNSVAQKAALEALSSRTVDKVEEMRATFEKRRNVGFEKLNTLPNVKTLKPQGAFYFYSDFSYYFGKEFNGKVIETNDDIAEFFINELYVVTVPGSAFGSKEHIRFSYACNEETFAEAVRRIGEGLKKLK